MDYNMDYFIIDLFATFLLYATLPLLISAFRKKPITLKAYRKWPTIISVIIVILLSFYYFLIGLERYAYNFAPAALWTWIGLSIGESILRKRGLMVRQEEYDAAHAEHAEHETKEEKTHPVLAVILGIIAVGILVFVGILIGISI